jgi:hypothetical protein
MISDRLTSRWRSLALCAFALTVTLASNAHAVIFLEGEPNDTKAAANVVSPMNPGDSIQGNSTATTGVGVDYFDVTMGTAPLGIYRNRLVITTAGAAGHTASLRGFGQVAAPPDTMAGIPWDGVVGAANTTESAIQTTSTATTPPRFNQWYSFGKGERVTYRINGGTTTTSDYVATLERDPVTPVDIGSYAPGLITLSTFGQGHSSDTDMWVYDASLNPIRGYGNDDESTLAGTPGTGATLQSWLPRDFTPGTYFLALSNFQLTTDQGSPSDDDFRTGQMMEFPNSILNSSTTTALNLAFQITDSAGTSLAVANTKVGPYDVNWFQFTVTPEPSSLGLAACGLLFFLKRKRG